MKKKKNPELGIGAYFLNLVIFIKLVLLTKLYRTKIQYT